MLRVAGKILDTLSYTLNDTLDKHRKKRQAEAFQENEGGRILSSAPRIDLDLDSPPSLPTQKETYWSPRTFADINQFVQPSSPHTSAELPLQPDYEAGDLVTAIRRSEHAGMRNKKHVGSPFQPHDTITTTRGSFKDGISDYIKKRKPAELIISGVHTQPQAVTSMPPPAKKQKTHQQERLIDRLKDDVNSPYFSSTGSDQPTTNSIQTALVGQPISNNAKRQVHGSRKGFAPVDDRAAAMNDGFDDSINVRDQRSLAHNELSSRQVPLLQTDTGAFKELDSRSATNIPEKRKAIPRKPEPRLADVLDDDEIANTAKPVRTANGNIARRERIPTTAGAHTSMTSKENRMLSVEDESLSMEDEEVTEQPVETVAVPAHHAGSTFSKQRAQDQPSLIAKDMTYVSYDDSSKHSVAMERASLSVPKKADYFLVQQEGDGQSEMVYFNQIRQYWTGDHDSVVSVLVQGPPSSTDSKQQAFWAFFTFANHSGVRALRISLNKVISASNASNKRYAITNKSESWLQETLEKLCRRAIDVAPPGDVVDASEIRSLENNDIIAGAPLRKSKKLRERLQNGETAQDQESNHYDEDKHDEIKYDQPSDDGASTKMTRRSSRKITAAQSRSNDSSDEVLRRVPSSTSATNRTSKRQRFPPFKDLPVSKSVWPKSLIYPSTGANRANVEFADLYRLDDGELLNDNLVQFGIKFAQELYPKLDDKIYVFNTYFYTSLTGGSTKHIIYDAVKRWTAKIDIFKYDHVVIPINQDTHWYMAIICNIRNIFNEDLSSVETGGSQEGVQNQAEELPDQVNKLSITTDETSVPTDINQSTSVSRSSASRPDDPKSVQKNRTQQRRQINASTPMIVTLDSLGSARSPVVGILKAYLREEARSKKGKEIPEAFLKRQGMSAKGIPTQTNFSDCGIYVIYYLAKLFEAPDEFISKLLGKSFIEGRDWLDSQNPSGMRFGFRLMILAKYMEQNPDFTKDLPPEDTKKIVESLEKGDIFAGLGKASAPTNALDEAHSNEGKLPTRNKPAVNPVNKPFKSPMIKKVPAEELAQAPSMDLPQSDEEESASTPIEPTPTADRRTAQQPKNISHGLDKLEDDLRARSSTEDATSEPVAATKKAKRSRSNVSLGTPDELSATPDAEHQVGFMQTPSRDSKVVVTSPKDMVTSVSAKMQHLDPDGTIISAGSGRPQANLEGSGSVKTSPLLDDRPQVNHLPLHLSSPYATSREAKAKRKAQFPDDQLRVNAEHDNDESIVKTPRHSKTKRLDGKLVRKRFRFEEEDGGISIENDDDGGGDIYDIPA